MSGIYGISDPFHKINAGETACISGRSMAHRSWYVVDQYIDENLNTSIGRVGIGIFNSAPQPVWNANHTVALCISGELYPDLRTGVSDEDMVLQAYEQYGETFARQLNGMFSIAVLDLKRGKLILTNDRFGLYPFYYSLYAGRLIFAAEMKGILADQLIPRTIDLTALAQYMRFQQLLGERTFFENLHLFPRGSVLVYDVHNGENSLSTYWSWNDIPARPETNFNDAVQEAGRLLRKAVIDRTSDNLRLGVYLSGGLDARTLLGLIEKRPVVSVTYGAPDSRDVVLARQIAKKVGSDHYWFDLSRGDWVRKYEDFHVDLVEANVNWLHSHGISTLEQARKLIDVGLIGWDGGTFFGHPDCVDPLQINAVDQAAFVNYLYTRFNQMYTWPGLDEAEERYLYSADIYKKVEGLAYESFYEEAVRYWNIRPDLRGELFTIDNHTGRMTGMMVLVYRSYFEIRLPYFDYDLVDFLFSLNAWLRADRRLLRAVIQKETPRLATIPYEHDEYWPTTRPIQRVYSLASTWMRRNINRHLLTIFNEHATLYADYENYLRGDLRGWAEGILFDRRTQDRGIFNIKALQSLMDRHQAGSELWTIGKIAPIISFEMMLRRLVDDDKISLPSVAEEIH
jgi:asparagine synthase (glutamine-hydrolysing)